MLLEKANPEQSGNQPNATGQTVAQPQESRQNDSKNIVNNGQDNKQIKQDNQINKDNRQNNQDDKLDNKDNKQNKDTAFNRGLKLGEQRILKSLKASGFDNIEALQKYISDMNRVKNVEDDKEIESMESQVTDKNIREALALKRESSKLKKVESEYQKIQEEKSKLEKQIKTENIKGMLRIELQKANCNNVELALRDSYLMGKIDLLDDKDFLILDDKGNPTPDSIADLIQNYSKDNPQIFTIAKKMETFNFASKMRTMNSNDSPQNVSPYVFANSKRSELNFKRLNAIDKVLKNNNQH